MTPKQKRSLALILTIVFDILMLLFWALSNHWGFFWCFVTINISVLAWEVINNFWLYGKTLSTETTHKIVEGGKRRVYIYLAITFMLLSMTALAFHLGIV